ncbi:hypothetical protein [Microbispora sp. H10830]|uniref:hypothetical protein n=1 Tax=Microbispora sp. H10830 TaxID=2729109 RepID=UPI0016018FF8|nr:hypothetical protein [Microbispora sp. H10830]
MAEQEAPAIEPTRGEKERGPDGGAEQNTQRDLHEELSEQKRQSRISAQNLDALYADTVIGGDDIGGASHRATDGGTVNAAGRDQYFFGVTAEDRAVFTVAVSAREVGVIRRCHVPTKSYGELLARLDSEHVLLLRGEPRAGQPTTALAALARWSGDDGRLAWLQMSGNPLHLAPGDLHEATGYLLQVGDDATWNGRPDQMLGHLRRTAERARARVVVLASPEFPEHDWAVDHEPPPMDQIFVNWLAHELHEGGEAHPQEWAGKTAADELVRETLAGYRCPRKARELALRVARGLLEDRSLDEILDSLPEQRRRKAQDLLAVETPRRARCFMIASAVLRGAPSAVVAAQTVKLATLIEEELARQTTIEQPPQPHVWEQLSDWLGFAEITLLSPRRGGDGQVVDFPDPSMAGTVLRVVWEEQPTIHEPLLTWLGELTEDKDPGVQMRAAQAIGLLATYDFLAIQRRFLSTWCQSERYLTHELAAWTLGSAAKDPDLTARVFECLGRWARGSRKEQSVVIRALGSWLGAYWVDEALRALATIAKTNARAFPQRVALSIAQIHQLGSNRTSHRSGVGDVPDNTRRIIAALAQWSAQSDLPGLTSAAALAFVRMLASPEGAKVLDLAADPGAAVDLVALWRHILDLAVTKDTGAALTPEAWSVLGDWLATWETDAGVRGVLSEVLTRPPVDVRAPLLFHLRLWHRTGEIDAGLAGRLAELVEGS